MSGQTKTVSATEAKSGFGEWLNATVKGDSIIIQRYGKELAAMMPIELFREFLANKKQGERTGDSDSLGEAFSRMCDTIPEDKREEVAQGMIDALRAHRDKVNR